jgi:S-adenosylmethionine-dependent methyltransferase
LSAVTALGSVLVATDARDQAGQGTQVTQPPMTGGSPRGRSPLLWASLRRVLDELGGTAAPRVLDCGGGTGSLAVPLAAQGAQVTVVDVSIDALSTLMRRAAESGVPDRITAVQGEAESLADLVPAAAFDLVLAHDVVEDLTNPVQAVGQLATVLRPAGVLSLVVVNPVAGVLKRVLAGDVGGALSALQRPAHQAYDVDVLSNLCRAAGLQIRSVEGLGVFTDLVPGIELERPGAIAALSELELAVAAQAPYRDIASRLHLLARRPGAG